ncbi:MAG: S8 family serine peptidase [Micromonosporaceae bacterium]|nr:S8 family serine peptidase [Micromonosporaceae bacterium]
MALALVLPLTAVSPAAAAPGGAADVVELSSLPAAAAGESVTLVTGDQVRLAPTGSDRWVAAVEPAPRAGQPPEFEVIEDGEDVYVLPSDAAPLIPDQLDRELFNLTKLTEFGYTDGVPVIVTGVPGGEPARAAAAQPDGLSVTAGLPSVDGYAATVAPGGDWWSTVAPAAAAGTARSLAALAGAEKVWLDEIAEVALDESVPMIGAPQAWADGYDGAGVTVAVLDTGIDQTHPDLAGQVAGTRNFTSEPGISDGHGHGTHVAGTVAGTGNGSDGRYTGVAPGADLLIGKICTASGTCPNSATIAGMEWAAAQADVVSISIGSRTGDDGTGVTAQAVNRLTEQHDTLFVIAAANNGARGAGGIGTPGSADAALTVGAVDKNGDLASFSSRGPRLGDFAIKPDITAPGVGIVAPRAAGTSMGTPVDDRYTAANGTSMATPHVAGAAAIALQRSPDLGAAELKADLVTTAAPNPELSVYQQGGGLADIPAALDAPVRATPAPLNLGFFRYPHDQAAPVSEQVTYTNRTDAEVTLDLTLGVTAGDGTAVPAAALSASPTTLTVPAGGTATATVTLDPRGLATGSYGGYLVADAGSAGGAVRTPVGFHLEQEMYDVTINGIARDGRPAARRSSSVHVRHAVDPLVFSANSIGFDDGVASFRVPPGPYFVMGRIGTLDGNDVTRQDRAFVGVPTLEVTQDTSVTLDAREANEITFDTPAHPDAAPFGQSRVIFNFEAETSHGITATYLGEWMPTFALETGPVTVGSGFEFLTNARLGDPPLTLEVVAPVATGLAPQPLRGTPPLDDDLALPLAFAGPGAESDYDGIDVTGKAVLTERDGPALADKEATARAHGAAALLVMNNATGFFTGSVGDAAGIPAMAISGQEGAMLRDLLADGEVTVRVAGTSFSPYLYDLFLSEPGRIPGELHYRVEPDELATLDNSFYSEPGQLLGEYRSAWRPYMTFAAVQYSELPGGVRRTEYVTADDTLFRQNVSAQFTTRGDLLERDTFHQPGEHQQREWFKAPMRPSVLEAFPPRNPGEPVVRTGSQMRVVLPEWWDNDGHYGSFDSVIDDAGFRFYQDGRLIGQASRPRVTISNLAPEPHTYRFEVDTARTADWWPTSTATRTAWTVRSAQPPTGETEVLPFLLVDYDTELDLTNTAPHPRDRNGPATVDLQVRHQVGADAPALGRATVAISYDDGDTWQQRPVVGLGDGHYRAFLDSKDPAETTGFLSIRIEVRDVDGNSIEQEITRAWRLGGR